MIEKELPLQIEGISESIYAGFWSRLGSLLLDTLIVLPVVFLIQYINGMSLNMYFYTIIPNLFFLVWYHVYLPKRFGGTPGKLIVGIAIIRLDGQSIGWKEAFLRHSIQLFLTLFIVIVTINSLQKADAKTYESLSWLLRSQYLMAFTPGLVRIYLWINNIWMYSEFIVLLTNSRKRAIHDYLAGTVIVKAKYFEQIDQVMGINQPSAN